MKVRISAIVAMAQNRVIGVKNQLPWKISEDLKRFKKVTLGHPILMGRKTLESIGRALPQRENLILTRNQNFSFPGVRVVESLDDALVFCSKNGFDELFIGGGAEVYQLVWPRIDRVHLTLIHRNFDGDAYFPDVDWSLFQEVERIDSSENGISFSFITLDKHS